MAPNSLPDRSQVLPSRLGGIWEGLGNDLGTTSGKIPDAVAMGGHKDPKDTETPGQDGSELRRTALPAFMLLHLRLILLCGQVVVPC